MNVRFCTQSVLSLAIAFAVSALADDVRVAPDRSLTVAQYLERGVPAPDREWTPADYAKLVGALKEIVAKDPLQLPRFDSESSGAIMSRVVATDNLAILSDETLSVKTRLAQAVILAQAVAGLASIYVDATNRADSFDRELVELTALIIAANVEMWELVDEFSATLSPEELEARKDALSTIRSGTAQVVQGALMTLSETNVYRPAELRRLASSLIPQLPSLIVRLSPDSATEARATLRNLRTEITDPQLRTLVEELSERVEAAVRPPA